MKLPHYLIFICLFITIFFAKLGYAQELLYGQEAFTKIFLNIKTNINKKTSYVEQKYFKENDVLLKSSGHLVFLENNALLFAQHEPFNLTVVMTDDRIMEILDEEKNILNKDNKPLIFNFTNLIFRLYNHDSNLYKDFDSQLQIDNKTFKLVLKPLDPLLNSLILSLEIIGQDEVKSIVISMQNGDYTKMDFTDFVNLSPQDEKHWKTYLEF